jgi:hypothetical protein
MLDKNKWDSISKGYNSEEGIRKISQLSPNNTLIRTLIVHSPMKLVEINFFKLKAFWIATKGIEEIKKISSREKNLW